MPAISFSWPSHIARHHDYVVTVDGQPCEVLESGCGAFVILEGEGAITVEARASRRATAIPEVAIKPRRLGLTAAVADRSISFTLPGPQDVLVEVPGGDDLFIFYGAPLVDVPSPDAAGVHYFAAGQVYEVGNLIVGTGEEVYIEGGAVVSGSIRVTKASGAKVRGRGLVDGSCWGTGFERNSFISEHSSEVLLEGLSFINSASWTVKPSASRGVSIQGIRILVHGGAHDGIDINGCQDVQVRGCFVRSDDDCYAIKSVHYGHPNREPRQDYCQNVDSVVIEDCVAYSFGGGSGLEIGHEFRCDTVRNITWRNIDILAVHDYGSALSIRQCDGALIENVLYEDIRCEHHYNAFLVFRIIKSRYSWDGHSERATIRNITLRRVHADLTRFNAGYTISDIGGWDADHGFDGIHFEDCSYGDTPIRSLDDFSCYAKYATGITFA